MEIEKIENYLDAPVKCEYTENIINYISGFVQKKIVAVMSCDECVDFFLSENTHEMPLLTTKNRGGLVKPNTDLCTLIQITSVILDEYVNCCNILVEKKIDLGK